MSEAAVLSPVVQDELFPEFEDNPALVELVRKKSFIRTGKILGKEPQRCRAICLDIIYGRSSGLMSDRQIAAKHRVSRNDFAAILAVMAARGELEPLTKQINSLLDMNTMLMGVRINEGLLEGTIHPGQIPIPWLYAMDKRAQRDAGLVQGTEVPVGDVAEANIRAYFSILERIESATESRSDARPTEPVDITPATSSPAAADTPANTPAPGAGDPVPAEPGPRPEGGGGGRPPAAARGPRGEPPENFNH